LKNPIIPGYIDIVIAIMGVQFGLTGYELA